MTQKRISRYIFSCLLLLLCIIVSAQEEVEKSRLSDSIPLRINGIRVGYDIGNFAYQALLKGFSEHEIQLELITTHPVVPVFEFGMGGTDLNQDSLYKYHYSGTYFKTGVEWNKKGKDHDLIAFGVRYGYGFGTHEFETAKIINEGFNGLYTSFPEEQYSGHWIELLYSMKVQLIKNIYLGWSVRGKLLISDGNSEIKPYILNGFGKMNRRTNAELNYYISYRLPF